MPLHELAHGWVAYKFGDRTAKNAGRLTFNPLVSIDPWGALMILLFGFGWARPVPVNPNNFKNPRVGMAVTAAAGPISNFLAALIGAFIYVAILVGSGSVSYTHLPVCGMNLNNSSCQCNKRQIDPRLEVLKQLID